MPAAAARKLRSVNDRPPGPSMGLTPTRDMADGDDPQPSDLTKLVFLLPDGRHGSVTAVRVRGANGRVVFRCAFPDDVRVQRGEIAPPD